MAAVEISLYIERAEDRYKANIYGNINELKGQWQKETVNYKCKQLKTVANSTNDQYRK